MQIDKKRKGMDSRMELDQQRRVKEGKLWLCDPSKNKRCNKQGCYYKYGGPCRYTANQKCKREEQ